MIYLLDRNGKEFAIAVSDMSYLLNFSKELIGIDEKGVFYSPSADGTERRYVKYVESNESSREFYTNFEIVGFDYKCKHYRLIDAGVAKEDFARRLF